jgi:hypothetical protein
MKRATRINLAVCAIALLLWLWLLRPPALEPALLFDQAVNTVRIEHVGVSREFKRDRCGWIQTEPRQLRANTAALDRLASLARSIPHRRYVAGALALEKLGFSQDSALTLNQQRVVLGGVEPINGWRYVRLPDGSIALLTDRFSDLLTKDLSDPNRALGCPDA